MIITLTDEQANDLMKALNEARLAYDRRLWQLEAGRLWQGEAGEVFRSMWEHRLKQIRDLFLDIQGQISQQKYGEKS